MNQAEKEQVKKTMRGEKRLLKGVLCPGCRGFINVIPCRLCAVREQQERRRTSEERL